MNKSILAVQHADGVREGICKCGQKMTWRDLGISQYISNGELIEQDHGGFWECPCGYRSDEEKDG